MEVEKLRTNKVAYEVTFLDYLPIELVLNILDRINDAKMLCNCTIVSKQFASIIYKIKSISLSIPGIDLGSFEVYSDLFQDSRAIMYFEDDESTWPIHPSSIQVIKKMITFLRNFRELESIDIEFGCPRNPCTSPLVKWKAKLDSRETAVKGLVSINPTSMYKLNDEEGFVQDEDYQMLSSQDNLQDDSLYPLISCTEWLFLIFSLMKSHDTLQRVICTDSHRHGSFVFEAEQIVEWRKRLINDNNDHPISERYPGTVMGHGWFKELHLPLTRYLMKRVSFMFMDCLVANKVYDNDDGGGGGDDDDDDDDDDADYDDEFECIMNWKYGDDETILGEAVNEIIESVGMV